IGMTMDEAADLMIGLGATEAINLDGGGSTAFVVDGAVTNRPSDRAVRRDGHTLVVKSPRPSDKLIGNVERPVAVALALVGPRLQRLGINPVSTGLVIPLGARGTPAGAGSSLVLSNVD